MEQQAKQLTSNGQANPAEQAGEGGSRKKPPRAVKPKDPRKGLDHELVGTGNQELPDGAPD